MAQTQFPSTKYAAMQTYQNAYRVHSALKQKHDLLVLEQVELLKEISAAECTMNKAREAMLQVIHNSPAPRS
jgi:vacuolar-type H+-ATPase subunit D/Vma8